MRLRSSAILLMMVSCCDDQRLRGEQMTDNQPMWLRLRQIALVAEKLAPVEEELIDVLGIEVC